MTGIPDDHANTNKAFQFTDKVAHLRVVLLWMSWDPFWRMNRSSQGMIDLRLIAQPHWTTVNPDR
jgi:hypothetical protein